MEEYERKISLIDLFNEIKRRATIVLAAGIILACVICVYEYAHDEEVYVATSTIYIETNYVEGNVPNNNTGNVPLDYIELIKSKAVIENVLDDLVNELSYEELIGMLSITNTEKTYVINININNRNAELAAVLSNEIAKSAVEILNDISEGYELRIIGTASIPQTPIPQNVVKNIIIAFFIGSFIAVMAIIGLFILRDGITNRDNDNMFKFLSNSIIKKDCHLRCILVTSSVANEGSVDVAKELSNTLKTIGKTVTFVNLDTPNINIQKKQIIEYIQESKEGDDFTIINAEYIENNPDIPDIVDISDGILLVVKRNFANRKKIKYANNKLQMVDCNIVGAVLTDK
ncbi:MAG: Wzz/FepE/Etk N-terminal domain-containing protein [Bacillota bacterium]|nr:Wzz/FepE/Etk N-terminal domain-containing protein [Bacillota bacterium]